jgi:hypothetical protein
MLNFKRLFRKRVTESEWAPQFEALKREVAGLPMGSGLWTGLLGLLDQYAGTEEDSLCQPGISNEELRRAQGRLGMIRDLQKDLAELPEIVKREEEERTRKANAAPGGAAVPGVLEQMR